MEDNLNPFYFIVQSAAEMDIYCKGTFHPGEKVIAEFMVIIPGDSTGGDTVSWYGGPEPDIRLNLCGSCKEIYVVQNGGLKKVIVEAIILRAPEGSLFSPAKREIL